MKVVHPNHLRMNFTEVGMDNFCTFHQQPHSERNFPLWINSMTLVMNQLLDSKLTKLAIEEEKSHGLEEAPEENYHCSMGLYVHARIGGRRTY